MTGDYIIFARIKPGVSKTVKGEKLRLACRLFESRGKVSGQYNVCSTAAFNNMIDEVKQTGEIEFVFKKYVFFFF